MHPHRVTLSKIQNSENPVIMRTILFHSTGTCDRLLKVVAVLLSLSSLTNSQTSSYQIYPYLYEIKPDIISPNTSGDTIEVVLVETKLNKFGLIPVTVENGEPLLYSYKVGTIMGKDQQLHIDNGDFPNLAKTGLHSDTDLDNLKMITGIPVDVINCTGRPNAYSISGFMAEDEDIISVLKGDNELVKSMNLTHAQLARPLFHVWNLILKEIELGNWQGRFYDNIKNIFYNGNLLEFRVSRSKGWQISIFFDEVQGRHDINVYRNLSKTEEAYLKTKYSKLDKDEQEVLTRMLTNLHFSEMLPYYIMHYGFYEGHTEDYRCDPIVIAFLFGLRSIEEIDRAFEGNLLNTLLKHHNSL
jgi:hypothetical protein